MMESATHLRSLFTTGSMHWVSARLTGSHGVGVGEALLVVAAAPHGLWMEHFLESCGCGKAGAFLPGAYLHYVSRNL